MKIIKSYGKDDLATVYLAEKDNKYIEFVQSIQPPIPIEEKWVIIISTLFGCPVKCKFCDAGGNYNGIISKELLLKQIAFLVNTKFPNGINTKRFKIQFARVGEPSFNKNVLSVLEILPSLYNNTQIMPSISTIAPENTDDFFNKLISIKNNYYSNGNFQLQFSIHSTDPNTRDYLMPIKKWDFEKIAKYGENFYSLNDRKITLNFALSNKSIINENELYKYFSPEKFLIKLTPTNPTINAKLNKINNIVYDNNIKIQLLIDKLKSKKYDIILSIGELEENQIGSNCGQYIKYFLDYKNRDIDSYSYIK